MEVLSELTFDGLFLHMERRGKLSLLRSLVICNLEPLNYIDEFFGVIV